MATAAAADIQYPTTTLTTLAFGSCHMNKAAMNPKKSDYQIIWPSIAKKVNPQSFLWLGDAIYSPRNKHETVASLDVLENEYSILLHNSTVGYIDFLASSSSSSLMSVHGTHDDHDYGGNDYGKHMPEKKKRTQLFSNFVRNSNKLIQMKLQGQERQQEQEFSQMDIQELYQQPQIQIQSQSQSQSTSTKTKTNTQNRNGMYTSIEYGSYPNIVKIILLDTRYDRDDHCPIPSIGAWRLPFKLGSPLACLSRWITAGLNLQSLEVFRSKCENAKVLSEEQWLWLEEQLDLDLDLDFESEGGQQVEDTEDDEEDDEKRTASVYIIGSSIQVLTTNPAIESWGHYPNERLRLLKLLNGVGKRRRRKNSGTNTDEDEDRACGQGRGRSPAVILLSGDVHHAEILDSSVGLKQNNNWNDGDGRIIEVTSSGLTHS